MIVDLFSHKIHSSGDEWPEKLAEIAAIFGEFDGQLYDRAAFEERLRKISPRASYLIGTARTTGGRLDVSKFRDEISAYPAYLGLYFLEQSPAGWVVRVSETARRFLLQEEPDVASFLRLQLPLFQYPNAMGAAYRSLTNNLRIQANVRNRTLEFIRGGVHFSPVRLISVALKVDAALRGVDLSHASVSFREVFGLANSRDVNSQALPSEEAVMVTLDAIRAGTIRPPDSFESRFHTLRHTEIFQLKHGKVSLREPATEEDRVQLIAQLDAVCSISHQFDGFDHCTTNDEIELVVKSGEWGRYFDGVKILPTSIVTALTSDKALETTRAIEPSTGRTRIVARPATMEVYPLRERRGGLSPVKGFDRAREIADPEAKRIKLQKRNLIHKELIDKMDAHLRSLGAQPKENDHIDLVAKIPNDGSFIFEMKSGGETLLEQIRKGLSQLYEYRYRYKAVLEDENPSLCLVLSEDPVQLPWITEFLCQDRGINLCWFDDDGNPAWPPLCDESMRFLQPQQQ